MNPMATKLQRYARIPTAKKQRLGRIPRPEQRPPMVVPPGKPPLRRIPVPPMGRGFPGGPPLLPQLPRWKRKMGGL